MEPGPSTAPIQPGTPEQSTPRLDSTISEPSTPTSKTWRLHRAKISSEDLTERLSYVPRPGLPSLTGLRAALLGYIGEIERALRERVVGEEDVMSDLQSSPSSFSGSGDDDSSAISSSVPGPSRLRRRFIQHTSDQQDGPEKGRDGGSYHGLLNHLSSLREDITHYLPTLSVPSVPTTPLISRGEWLKNLPHRLRILDLSVAPLPPDHRTPSSPIIDDSGSVEHARKKVLELVKAYLPDEDWSGWERLGWEDQIEATSSRRHSLDINKGTEIDGEEEEEPSWLFPNRTPASAEAFQSRRRAVRSKSLGAASFPSRKDLPRLVRTRTEPFDLVYKSEDDTVVDKDDEDDIEPTDILVHSELIDGLNLDRISSATRLGPTVVEALERSDDGKRLLEYEDLPFLWRNNEHIVTGYRFIPLHANTGPIPLIKSAFTWHNETVNIHSHFIPTILISIFIPIMVYMSPLPDAHFLDTTTLVVYLLAASACLISSAGWHVLAGCASHKWFGWGACVDYIGISWLIAASFFTVLYNAFYCQPKTVLLYSSVNLTCGILGSYLPFQKWFNERKNKHLRISFFLFLCVAMFAPMLQLFYQHGRQRGKAFVAPFVPSIIAYCSGLVFYAFHFPECVWPGKFDYYGASHNIWHVGIVTAIVLHYLAIFKAHGMRYEYSCAMPGAHFSVGEVVERAWWIGLRSLGLAN